MDFWKSRTAPDGESEERGDAPKPTFLQNLTEFVKDEAKDEALSSAVEYLTDGWLTYDGGDDDEEEDDKRRRGRKADEGTFEKRLQRRLAGLAPQPDTSATERPQMPVEAAAPVALPQTPTAIQMPPRPALAPRPPVRRATGFGRKGL
jgi:hypothetical protein